MLAYILGALAIVVLSLIYMMALIKIASEAGAASPDASTGPATTPAVPDSPPPAADGTGLV